MQDCYAGDIGDYGKFALLRELHKQGFSIGINWYKTEAITSEKQNDGKYCILDQFAVYDVDLSTKLKKVFYSQCGLARSIEALEAGKIIDDTSYFSEKVPMDHRNKWHQRALEKLSDSDLIFLDPDNGMIVPSARNDSHRQCKYVFDIEVEDWLCQGHSVLIYQHRPRINEENYFNMMIQRFMSMNYQIKRNDIQVITFPRYSVRDYFAISISEDHRLKIKRAITNMVNGIWGSGKKQMCRLPKSNGYTNNSLNPNSQIAY